MNQITSKQFAALCYLVIQDHHGNGYKEAHPTYIEEKLVMLDEGYNAYSFLDRENQLKVLNYLKNWNYELPKKINEYENYAKNPKKD